MQSSANSRIASRAATLYPIRLTLEQSCRMFDYLSISFFLRDVRCEGSCIGMDLFLCVTGVYMGSYGEGPTIVRFWGSMAYGRVQ